MVTGQNRRNLSAIARRAALAGAAAVLLAWAGLEPSPVTGAPGVAVPLASPQAVSHACLATTSPCLSVTPGTVVPNQIVHLVGSGFTASGDATIDMNSITFGAAPATHPAIMVASGGVWFISLSMPLNATIPGLHLVSATDSSGIIATQSVSVASRTLSITPTESPRGSVVDVQGSGFPAHAIVDISYNSTRVAEAAASETGAFSTEFTVPDSAADLPNIVSATAAGPGAIVAYAAHSVPQFTMSISPTSGPPGTTITITGQAYRPFAAINSVTVGAVPALRADQTTTDASGSFVVTATIPQQGEGPLPVAVSVGGVDSWQLFTVIDAPESSAESGARDPAIAFAELGSTGVLNIVVALDAATGRWQAYIPELSGNTLTLIRPHSVLFITLTKDTTITVSGVTFSIKADTSTPIPVGGQVSIGVA